MYHRSAGPTRSNCALRAKQEHREPSPICCSTEGMVVGSRRHGVAAMASPPGIARLGHIAVTVVYARAIFNLSSGKVGPLVALLLRVGILVIFGYFSKSLSSPWLRHLALRDLVMLLLLLCMQEPFSIYHQQKLAR